MNKLVICFLVLSCLSLVVNIGKAGYVPTCMSDRCPCRGRCYPHESFAGYCRSFNCRHLRRCCPYGQYSGGG